MTRKISSNNEQSQKKFKTAIILKDGTSLNMRAIRKDDEDKLLSLFYRLSSRTIHMRFRYPLKEMSKEEFLNQRWFVSRLIKYVYERAE